VACCFSDNGTGAPDVSGGAGKACANAKCGLTSCEGGVIDASPVAFEAGVPWDTSKVDCTGPTITSLNTCNACCLANFNIYRSMIDQCTGENVGNKPPYSGQSADYLAACYNDCGGREY
jgi:hypothetical protein